MADRTIHEVGKEIESRAALCGLRVIELSLVDERKDKQTELQVVFAVPISRGVGYHAVKAFCFWSFASGENQAERFDDVWRQIMKSVFTSLMGLG